MVRSFTISLIVSLLNFQLLHAQTNEVTIRGTLENVGLYCPNFPKIILFENKDTLLISDCNEKGKFLFITKFTNGNSYSIQLSTAEHFPVQLLAKSDSLQSSWIYDITIPKSYSPRILQDNERYEFKFNEVKKENLDLSAIKCLSTNNPGICLEICQFFNPAEKKRVVKKRAEYFKQQLTLEGIDTNRITFVQKALILKNSSNTYDSFSRFEAAILSLEGCD